MLARAAYKSALAATSIASARRISGRRHNKSEGNPGSTTGTRIPSTDLPTTFKEDGVRPNKVAKRVKARSRCCINAVT